MLIEGIIRVIDGFEDKVDLKTTRRISQISDQLDVSSRICLRVRIVLPEVGLEIKLNLKTPKTNFTDIGSTSCQISNLPQNRWD